MSEALPTAAPATALPASPHDGAEDGERFAAMQALGSETPDALALLYHGLGDGSLRVRKAALAAVARLPRGPQLVSVLLGGLAVGDNVGLRNACAEGLAQVGEAAVEPLVAALATADVDTRKFVAEVLGAIGGDAAVAGLLGALGQDDPNVRAAAVDALGRSGGALAQGRLLERLQAAGDDLQTVAYLLEALAQTAARLPVATLLPYAGRRPLARFVFPLLALSHDAAALGPLLQATLGEHRGNRRVALRALAQLLQALPTLDSQGVQEQLRESKRAESLLLEALADADVGVAAAAMTLLGVMQAAACAPVVLQRAAALNLAQVGLEAVASMGDAVVAPLVAAMEHADVQVQLLYLDAIEAVGDPQAVPALRHAMAAPHPHLAAAAVRLVGKLGDQDDVAALMALVPRRDEPEITAQVACALASIGARRPSAVATHMRRAIGTGDVQPAWLQVLGTLTRPQDLDVILAATRHTHFAVRDAAFGAAQSFAGALPEDVICLGLADPHPRVRTAAARVARAVPEPMVVSALLAALHDADPWVVAQAATALGGAQVREAVPALLEAARSPVAPIALAALHSLRELRAPELAQVVLGALGHGDSEVVREALAVAGTLPGEAVGAACVAALRHRAWDVRAAAAEQLRRLQVPVDAALLDACLAREDEPLVRDRMALLRRHGGGTR